MDARLEDKGDRRALRHIGYKCGRKCNRLSAWRSARITLAVRVGIGASLGPMAVLARRYNPRQPPGEGHAQSTKRCWLRHIRPSAALIATESLLPGGIGVVAKLATTFLAGSGRIDGVASHGIGVKFVCFGSIGSE